MAVYNITFTQRTDNYAVVTLLTEADLTLGTSITIGSVSATMNGTQTIYAFPPYLFLGTNDIGEPEYNLQVAVANQVMFYNAGVDVARDDLIPQGTLSYVPVCTWVSAAQISTWLGIGVATADDETFITQCAAAANAFCFRRRQESGYVDSLTLVPSGDVSLGVIQYGGMLYRQRGSIDAFASFDGLTGAPVQGLNGIIKQLLGINRPQVA